MHLFKEGATVAVCSFSAVGKIRHDQGIKRKKSIVITNAQAQMESADFSTCANYGAKHTDLKKNVLNVAEMVKIYNKYL